MDDKRGFALYLGKIQDMIDDVREKQAPNVLRAAEMIAASLEQGGILHVQGLAVVWPEGTVVVPRHIGQDRETEWTREEVSSCWPSTCTLSRKPPP